MKVPAYVYPLKGCTPTKEVLQVAKELRQKFGKSDVLIERLIHGQFVVKHELTSEKVVVYTV
jgi:hypothetical protein